MSCSTPKIHIDLEWVLVIGIFKVSPGDSIILPEFKKKNHYEGYSMI